jgi:hypothetical protein
VVCPRPGEEIEQSYGNGTDFQEGERAREREREREMNHDPAGAPYGATLRYVVACSGRGGGGGRCAAARFGGLGDE